jgi:HAD superfamily hydrolase (TIGR01509 family)
MDAHPSPPGGQPIRGVIFDLHATLVHAGEPSGWMAAALTLLEQDPTLGGRFDPAESAPDALPELADLAPWAERIWEHARVVDPGSERDLSPALHRQVYDRMLDHIGIIPPALGEALYRTMLDQWQAYLEAPSVLTALRAQGVATAILSNVGIDPRGVLQRTGLAGLYDAEVFSFEVGVVKPDPAIFAIAAERLGLSAHELLMVGDTVDDDGAAAHLGMRTLILPRTRGTTHGLEQVLRLVGTG